MKTTLLVGLYACVVVVGTVRVRWVAMDAHATLSPHPLERAVPADQRRASEATGMPLRVDDTELGKVRRGGNDSRHLLYFGTSPKRAVSVFTTGRRFSGIHPASGWSPEDIGPGKLAYVRKISNNRVAVSWIHGDRRCVAIGNRTRAEMLDWVSSAMAGHGEP